MGEESAKAPGLGLAADARTLTIKPCECGECSECYWRIRFEADAKVCTAVCQENVSLRAQVAKLEETVLWQKSQRDDNQNAWLCEKAKREQAEAGEMLTRSKLQAAEQMRALAEAEAKKAQSDMLDAVRFWVQKHDAAVSDRNAQHDRAVQAEADRDAWRQAAGWEPNGFGPQTPAEVPLFRKADRKVWGQVTGVKISKLESRVRELERWKERHKCDMHAAECDRDQWRQVAEDRAERDGKEIVRLAAASAQAMQILLLEPGEALGAKLIDDPLVGLVAGFVADCRRIPRDRIRAELEGLE